MSDYKVGYLIGSLAKGSINRKLAKALVRLGPAEESRPSVLARNREAQTPRLGDTHERGHARVAVFAERFVERFTGHAGFLRHGCYSASAGNIAQGLPDNDGIAILECSFDLGEDSFLAVQEFSHVPTGGCDCHFRPPWPLRGPS